MKYPTEKEVLEADRLQISKWYRFLECARDEEEIKIIKIIDSRLKAFGGMSAEISKKIGWHK